MPETAAPAPGTAPASWQAGPPPLSASEERARRDCASWCLYEGIDPQAACQLTDALAALVARYGERLDAVRSVSGAAYARVFAGARHSPMAFALVGVAAGQEAAQEGEDGRGVGTLLVNRDFFRSPECFRQWRDHNFAVADPTLHGVLAHEYAHLLAHKRRWPAAEAFAAFLAGGGRGLSDYATQDPDEMLAEAFAAHEAGRWLPPALASLHGWFSAAEADASRRRDQPRQARFSDEGPPGETPPVLSAADERLLDAAWASLAQASFAGEAGAGAKGDLDPDGRWVTVRGQHLHIDGQGAIEAGGHPELRKAMAGKAGGLPEPSWPKMASVECKPHVREAFAKLLGREATDELIAGLAGSEPGAAVRTGMSQGGPPEGLPGKGPVLSVGTRTDSYRSTRLFYTGEDGKPACYNHIIHMVGDAKPGGGLGTRVFARQVANLASLGFGAIRCDAVSSQPEGKVTQHFLGAYTWPRLGYDGPVPPEARPHLVGPFAKAATMHELMAMPGGAKHWREVNEEAPHDIVVKAAFDLSEGSASRRVLGAYLREKAQAGKPVFSGAWDEGLHPRGADGRFARAGDAGQQWEGAGGTRITSQGVRASDTGDVIHLRVDTSRTVVVPGQGPVESAGPVAMIDARRQGGAIVLVKAHADPELEGRGLPRRLMGELCASALVEGLPVRTSGVLSEAGQRMMGKLVRDGLARELPGGGHELDRAKMARLAGRASLDIHASYGPADARPQAIPQDVPAELSQAAHAWHAALSQPEKDAVHGYTGFSYRYLNKALRQCPDTQDCLSDKQKAMAKGLTSALDAFPPHKEPATSWRGLNCNDPATLAGIEAGLKAAMASGEPVAFPGFASASLDASLPATEAVLEFRSRRGAYIAPFSENVAEAELLFGHQSRWKVVAVHENVPVARRDGGPAISHPRVYVLEDAGPAPSASATTADPFVGRQPGGPAPGGLAGPAPARPADAGPAGLRHAATPEAQASWHAARAAVGASVDGWLEDARARGVAPEALAFYRKAASDTFDGMPWQCLERVRRNVEKVGFRQGLAAVTQEYGEIAGKKPDSPVGGFWSYDPAKKQGELVLDGGRDTGESYDMLGQSAEDARGIYAHEFAHAVDGTRKFHSSSPEWQAAWREEVWRDKVDRSRHDWKRRTEDYPLTRYASKNESEGFAEFGRLVFTRPEDAERLFPKCWAAWKKRELI